MKERESLKELIHYWTEYLETEEAPSIADFSNWLFKQVNEEQAESQSNENEAIGVKMELGHYLGRIINFTDLWGKLAFKDLPIRQFEDFGILYEVMEKRNPSKMEVANTLVNEKSTSIERIKRLIKQSLLSEHIDQNDRRIRRITITKLGEEVLEQAKVQAMKVSQLLTWPMDLDDIKGMLHHFKQLDSFHTKIYHKGDYDKIDDLI